MQTQKATESVRSLAQRVSIAEFFGAFHRSGGKSITNSPAQERKTFINPPGSLSLSISYPQMVVPSQHAINLRLKTEVCGCMLSSAETKRERESERASEREVETNRQRIIKKIFNLPD